MQRRVLGRVIVAGAVIALATATSPGSGAAADPAVTVATSVVYGTNGPDTPLPVAITLGNDTAAIIVSAGGFIADAACDAPFAATTDFGETTITHDTDPTIAATTVVNCDLAIALGTTGATSVDLVVSERDQFNVELGASTTSIALEAVDVTVTVGDVALTGGTYMPAEPRSVGDELSRSVGFELAASRSIDVVGPTGTTMTGCTAAAATTATCDLSRVLSLADLAAGTIAMSPTLTVDGWPVAVPDADVTVPSERRLAITAEAVTSIVRAGEIVTVDATVENIGTIDVTSLALGGAGFTTEAATCGSDPIESITLTPGDVVTCRIARRVTAADIDTVTAMTVRGTSPFGEDSDLIDDDPTSSTDIDTATIEAPFTVIAADATGALSAAPGVVFIDDGGTDALPLTLSLLSAGELDNAVVTLPVEPHAGVTVTGCDEIVGADCRIVVGDIAADEPVSRSIGLTIDGAAVGSAGLDAAPITARLSAAGGVEADLTPTTVSTAGATVTVATDRIDVSGTDMTVGITVRAAPGIATSVVIGPADGRPVTFESCRLADDSAVGVIAVGDAWSFGTLAADDLVTCTMRRPVVDADRTDAATTVALAVDLAAGTGTAQRTVSTVVPTRSLVVTALTADTAPASGFSTDGANGRPNVVRVSFDVFVRGDGTDVEAPTLTGDDSYTCDRSVDAGTVRYSCVGEHTISAGDLASGSYEWIVDVDVAGFDPVRVEASIPTLHTNLQLTVTELSTPASPGGYRVGDVVRLLVQMRNLGTLPLELDGLTIPEQLRVIRYEVTGLALRSTSTEGLDTGCLSRSVLDPAETLDCGLVVEVLDTAGGGAFAFGLEALGASASFSLSVVVDPTVDAPLDEGDDPELPATGGGSRTLLTSALALVAVGLAMSIAGRRPAVVTTAGHRR